MKTFFAALILGCSLAMPIRATELSLAGGTTRPTVKPAGGETDAARIRLGLDRNEKNDATEYELPAVQISGPPGGTTAPTGLDGQAGTGAQDWTKSGLAQGLALDAPTSERTMAAVPSVLPSSSATNSGVSSTLVCVGLGVLAVAVGWVCAASVRQNRSVAPWQPGGSQERGRSVRVKMTPFKG